MSELAKNLPVEYEYVKVNNSPDSCETRIKGVTTAEDAYAWLESYSDLTMTTWRINKTYPHSGRINVFKRYFRCQHKTDGRHRGLVPQKRRTSKNTDCPAQIEIVIKRFNPRSRSKYPDKWTEEFPAFVRFRNDHNHKTSDALALKHRDMSVDTREKLFSLFRAGHTPSSARNFLKMEMCLNHPDSCKEKLLDTHFVPSVSVVTHLYRTIPRENSCDNFALSNTSTRVTARELKVVMGDMLTESAEQHPRPNRTKRKQIVSTVADDAVDDSVLEQSLELPVEGEVIDHCSYSSFDQNLELTTDWCCNVVDQFCVRVKQCIADNPQSFVPAVAKMHQNLLSSATTEQGLLSTLYTIGCFNT